MPIPDSKLSSWSHHYSGEASKQAHKSIRKSLKSYTLGAKVFSHNIFLQGSYKNDTNLRRDSDVDVVVQLAVELPSQVATLSDIQLGDDQKHKLIYDKWGSFRRQVLKALRATYGIEAVTTGRKSIKVAKGELHASADVVVTVKCGDGVAFYLPAEHRWVVSYPEQHHARGGRKEKVTSNRFKRTIRMFKTARNHLEDNHLIKKGTAPSYFIECLLYNVPDELFGTKLTQSYSEIVKYLETAKLKHFECQNGIHKLFGPPKDLWSQNEARKFIQALRRLWKEWPEST